MLPHEQSIIDDEIMQEFVADAIAHIQNAESSLMNMEKTSANSDDVNSIFRAVHSVKGTAHLFGAELKNIVDLAHDMESVFGEIRNGKLTLSKNMTGILLSALDCLMYMVKHIPKSKLYDISEHRQNLKDIRENKIPEIVEELNPTLLPKQPEVVPSIVENSVEELNEEENYPESALTPKELLQKAAKQGHNLYLIYFVIDDTHITPIEFIKKIQSIGVIIESDLDIGMLSKIDASGGYSDFLLNDTYYIFIIATMLDKQSVARELNVNELKQLDINSKYKELKTILKESSMSAYRATTSTSTTNFTIEKFNKTSQQTATMNIEETIRVKVPLLDELLDNTIELVLGRNQLKSTMDSYKKQFPEMQTVLPNIYSVISKIQKKIMRTRMQPISNVFNRLQRLIRDLSDKVQKDVFQIIEGTPIEVDKSIIELLGDPLSHLIRNAIDHGLETTSEREKLGKPTKGTIEIKAYTEGAYVNIEVRDDGAGINIENIKKRALDKGFIKPDDITTMTEQDILNIIFKPGFSTASSVTDVSGRGVGLDVVKTNIEKIGGSIKVSTFLGKGTTFKLILPITLTIIPSLLVESGGNTFAVPWVKLHRVMRIKYDSNTPPFKCIHNEEVLQLEDRLIPIMRLSELLGLETMPEIEHNDNPKTILRLLILKSGTNKFGLVVDKILDNADEEDDEILIKHLPRYLKDCVYFSGVTILGNGKPAMILNPDGIYIKPDDEAPTKIVDPVVDTGKLYNLLIFKCSGNELFALDFSTVSRIEKVSASAIEAIGDKEYLKLNNKLFSVVRLENYLPVSVQQNEPKFLYFIIPKNDANSIGIIAEKIVGDIQENLHIDTKCIHAKGLSGTFILQNRIVLLININEIAPKHTTKTVLVVEDSPIVAKSVKEGLEEIGYTVILSDNGENALNILENNIVNLIVSDIQMPIMDGLELVNHLKSNPKYQSIPIIAFTSLKDEDFITKALDAGFICVVNKSEKIALIRIVDIALKEGSLNDR